VEPKEQNVEEKNKCLLITGMSELQLLRGQLIQLRAENERLKRELESAYEKINLLEIKNPIQLLTPITNDDISYVCTKRILPYEGIDSATTPQHESKKSGKKTSI
jgi:hypothetical protein